MIDGDFAGVDARLKALDKECNQTSVAPRDNADRVAVFVPTWNIETWLAYLNGETVDENKKNYPSPSLTRVFESGYYSGG